jgi:hypothetical protein
VGCWAKGAVLKLTLKAQYKYSKTNIIYFLFLSEVEGERGQKSLLKDS